MLRKGNVARIAGAIALSTFFSDPVLFSQDSSASLPATSNSAKVSGTISYHSATRLPPNAVVYISLIDVSPRQDTSSGVLARQTITDLDATPIAFEIPYDRAKICAACTYAIQAQIVVKGRVRFRNISAYLVLTRGNPTMANVMLEPV